MLILLLWMAMGFVAMQIAQKKGRSQVLWLMLGIVFGIFAVLTIALLPAA